MDLFNLSGNNESVTTTPSPITPSISQSLSPTQTYVTPKISPVALSGVQQVDWVYGGQGICWSAWTVGGICTLFSHEGGVTTPSMKDLNHDGALDIECSEGNGSRQATSIKNVSNSPITIDCERYTCTSCTSGNGSHAQCDGAIDDRAIRVFDQVTLSPGCTATCTLSGATGSCLGSPENPSPSPTNGPSPIPSPDFPGLTPTTTVPTIQPTRVPSPQNSPVLPSVSPEVKTKITDTKIEEIIRNLVDDDTISGFDQKQTRLTGTKGYETEMNYLLKMFIDAGVQAEIQNATGVDAKYSNLNCPKDVPIFNLIARIPGKNSDKYVLTAHLDSREENLDPVLPAPGADRNSSGVAAVVSAAIALSAQKPENTIEFVLFGGTEQGLCGSAFYMQTVKNSNQNILGAINLDMIGNPQPDQKQCVNIGYKDEKGRRIAESFLAMRDKLSVDRDGSLLATNYDASNHKNFFDNGIPVAIISECNINDRYFTQKDTLLDENGNYLLSIPQITKTAQIVAGAMLELSKNSVSTPTVTIGSSPTPSAPQGPSPTPRASGSLLPVAFHYYHYEGEVNQYPPTYVYGNLNRSYSASKTQSEINGLAEINGNVVKMLMVSEYGALEQILNNHADAIRNAGIIWIGYNAERDGRTPQDELNNIFSASSSTNTLNRLGQMVAKYGLKLMFGPTTPMWNEYFNGNNGDVAAIATAMVGDNCALDGIAFQEQNQLGSSSTPQQRKDVLSQRAEFFRKQASSCSDFEVMVQIMPQQCKQNLSWEQCREFYRMLSGLNGNSRINSLGIWANPNPDEKAQALEFIKFLRQ